MLEILCVIVTAAAYMVCTKIYARLRVALLNPILTTLVVLVLFLSVTRISYATYIGGAHIFTYMLNPATVAFAVPLYKNAHLIKKHAVEIAVSLVTGSVVAVATSVMFARTFHLNRPITESLAPRSVTTPIAMDISHQLGGVPVLTAVFVIMTALVALMVGPATIRWLRIRTSMAKGMSLGMAAHGLGTSMAFEMGQTEGTFASLSMILAAVITIAVAPLVSHFVFTL